MSLIRSLITGNSGSYTLCGIPIIFFDTDEKYIYQNLNGSVLSPIANKIRNSFIFNILSQSNCHMLAHEMSHALMFKFFSCFPKEININTKTNKSTLLLDSEHYSEYYDINPWKKTCIHIAGSMGNIFFSMAKICGALALRNYISSPIAFLISGATSIWIIGELFYSYTSCIKKDYGDFGRIAQNGLAHSIVAATALVTQTILSAFAIYKFL